MSGSAVVCRGSHAVRDHPARSTACTRTQFPRGSPDRSRGTTRPPGPHPVHSPEHPVGSGDRNVPPLAHTSRQPSRFRIRRRLISSTTSLSRHYTETLWQPLQSHLTNVRRRSGNPPGQPRMQGSVSDLDNRRQAQVFPRDLRSLAIHIVDDPFVELWHQPPVGQKPSTLDC